MSGDAIRIELMAGRAVLVRSVMLMNVGARALPKARGICGGTAFKNQRSLGLLCSARTLVVARRAAHAMSESEEEVEKPPERRAPSGRASKGNRMSRLIAEEASDLEDEDDADKDFYKQGFWAEEEEDVDFAADADDEEGRDSFDSDFGDSTESDSDDDDGEERAAKRPAPKKKSVYRDPKIARKKGEAEAEGGAAKPKPKKRPRADPASLPPLEARTRESFRGSTQAASRNAEEARKRLEEEQRKRQQKALEAGKKRGVELHRLTQAEILAEAQQTEIINKASLERMLRQEEDKRRVIVRERDTDGPRVKYHSKRQGDSVLNTVTFVDTPVPPVIDAIAPPYPVPLRCAVTAAVARYVDPATGTPYATLEAFRQMKGRTGRRQSFGGGATAPATPAE
jgi:vacuolar protein sorting-associated protein 72